MHVHRRVRIKKPLGKKRLDEIGVEDTAKLKSSLAVLSPKSANDVLTTLSACLELFWA